MSRLKLIQGSKKRNESNLRFLDGVLKDKDTPLSQKEYLTFALHFAKNGDHVSARKFLKKLTSFYFSIEIYKDLYYALLAWSIRDTIWNETMMKEYQYFLVVKESMLIFVDFDFPAKKEFMEFRLNFAKKTTVIR